MCVKGIMILFELILSLIEELYQHSCWFDWPLVIPKDQGCISYFDGCSSDVSDGRFRTMKR
ncbi:hypothetical protein [Candidatus Hodgkinia cicadicola]|uniref:hypothetical protein n=1 Tax=Candidatus Hodgkinia cicadicola TaxID=573658 RepID=UPI0011BAB089